MSRGTRVRQVFKGERLENSGSPSSRIKTLKDVLPKYLTKRKFGTTTTTKGGEERRRTTTGTCQNPRCKMGYVHGTPLKRNAVSLFAARH